MKRRTAVFVLFFICSVLSDSFKHQQLVKVKSIKDSQIIFKAKGHVINKATFLHIRFNVSMDQILNYSEEIVGKLQYILESEKNLSSNPITKVLEKHEEFSKDAHFKEVSGLFRDRAKDGVVICSLLLKMFQSQISRLKTALSITVKPEFHNGTMAHQRVKKDVLGGIALAVGLRNMYYINELERQFANMSAKYNTLVDSVQLLNKHVLDVSMNVELLQQLLKMISHKNYHKIITLVVVLNDQLKDTIDSIHNIILQGQHKRMSTKLLSGEQSVELFERIREVASQQGCEMVLQDPSDLFEIEASYGYDQEAKYFAVYLHVPLVEPDELLVLYKYIPFPLYLESLGYNRTVLPQGYEDYIAILPFRSENSKTTAHRYRSLSESELNDCFRLRHTYLCSGRNTLLTNAEDTCIGALFLKQSKLIETRCSVEISNIPQFAAKLGHGHWMVYSVNTYSAMAQCGSFKETVTIEKTVDLRMPENCKLDLNNMELSTDSHMDEDHPSNLITWAYSGEIFRDFTADKITSTDLINDLLKIKNRVDLKDLAHLKHFYAHTENHLSKIWDYLSGFSIFSFFGNTTLVILVIVFIYVAARCGWFKLCYNCLRSRREESHYNIAHFYRQVARRATVRPQGVRQVAPPNLAILEANLPPAYDNVSAPIIQDRNMANAPNLHISEREYNPPIMADRFMFDGNGDEVMVSERCNPGPQVRGDLNDFICNRHVSRGQPGYCSGYFVSK